MTEVLIATDSAAVFDEVEAALVDESTTLTWVRSGVEVPPLVARSEPDLVVLDLQIGNMGGIATCMHLRHEIDDDRLPDIPILMLLDRAADVMLARRSGADSWLVKPLDAFSLRRAATAVLDGRAEQQQPSMASGRSSDVNPA